MGAGMANRLFIFLAGAAIGTVVGVFVASFGGRDLTRLAVMSIRSVVYRLLGRREGVRFDVLLQ